jgi:hypothetical protein
MKGWGCGFGNDSWHIHCLHWLRSVGQSEKLVLLFSWIMSALHSRVYQNLLVNPVLCHMNPVHTFTLCVFKIGLNSLRRCSPTLSLVSRLRCYVHFVQLRYACYVYRLLHCRWYTHLDYIRWKLRFSDSTSQFSASYFGVRAFRFWIWYLLPWLKFLEGFLSLTRHMMGQFLKLGGDCFLEDSL